MNVVERERIIKKIENQIWYDYIKSSFPVEVDKIINEFSERFDNTGKLIDFSLIYRYDDLVRVVGSETIKDLKRYFEIFTPLSSIKVDDLSFEELCKIDFLIDMFPIASVAGEFNLTFIMEQEIERMHGKEIASVRG